MITPTEYSSEKNALKEALIIIFLAIFAAILVKLPTLFNLQPDTIDSFYLRNISFFVFPLLIGYFAWKRKLKSQSLITIGSIIIVGLIIANIYPFAEGSDTEVLFAIHMPIILWLALGVAFAGNEWNLVQGRMNFIRFSGEFFIYYVLIALSGGVLVAFMAVLFGTIHIDIEPFFEAWLLPCGAAGAVIIAAWLAEIRNDLAVNFAPVLAKLFSPLFALMLITFIGTLIITGNELIIDRNILIAFDLLLIVALGLLLYTISSREPNATPGVFDMIQVVLLVSALLADTLALWGISGRIVEFGFTPNRIAALGLNLILIVNLTWAVLLNVRFLRGSIEFPILKKWQTDYLPVYGIWAVIIVILFPLLFGFE